MNAAEISSAPSRPRWAPLACAALVGLTLCAYSNGLKGPFLFDDIDSVARNPTIRTLWPPWAALAPPGNSTVNRRPVLNLSFAINRAISGESTWSYHAANLAIHLCAGLVLFGIVRRTLLKPPLRGRFGAGATLVGFFSALLWMLHPVQTQSVTYIVQRAESLMGLFYLLTLYLFIRGTEEENPAGWLALSVVCCLLGMATKESMATAPLMVLLYDRTFDAGSVLAGLKQRRWYYAALAATECALLPFVLSGGSRDRTSGWGVGIPWWGYVRTQFGAIDHYLRVAFWPAGMRLYYERGGTIDFSKPPHALVVLLDALPVAALVAATVWALRRRPAIGFLGAWFLVILAPTSLVPGRSDIMADRRLYLPLAAVAVLAAAAAYRWAGRKPLPALGALALVLGIATERFNTVFASGTSFWQAQVNARPDDPLALMNLGNAYIAEARFDRAIGAYQAALKIDPYYVDALYGMGAAYENKGDYPESVRRYSFALELARHNVGGAADRVPALEDLLGHALLQADRPEEARAHFRAALRYRPNNPILHFYLGLADGRTDRYSEALQEMREALKLDPALQPARDILAKAAAAGLR